MRIPHSTEEGSNPESKKFVRPEDSGLRDPYHPKRYEPSFFGDESIYHDIIKKRLAEQDQEDFANKNMMDPVSGEPESEMSGNSNRQSLAGRIIDAAGKQKFSRNDLELIKKYLTKVDQGYTLTDQEKGHIMDAASKRAVIYIDRHIKQITSAQKAAQAKYQGR